MPAVVVQAAKRDAAGTCRPRGAEGGGGRKRIPWPILAATSFFDGHNICSACAIFNRLSCAIEFITATPSPARQSAALVQPRSMWTASPLRHLVRRCVYCVSPTDLFAGRSRSAAPDRRRRGRRARAPGPAQAVPWTAVARTALSLTAAASPCSGDPVRQGGPRRRCCAIGRGGRRRARATPGWGGHRREGAGQKRIPRPVQAVSSFFGPYDRERAGHIER